MVLYGIESLVFPSCHPFFTKSCDSVFGSLVVTSGDILKVCVSWSTFGTINPFKHMASSTSPVNAALHHLSPSASSMPRSSHKEKKNIT